MASSHANAVEAVLFYAAEPVELRDLARFFDCDENDIREALQEIEGRQQGGMQLIQTETTAALATTSEQSDVIERRKKEEKQQPLSRAASETLSIILYRGPISRADIDYIRGVNSTAMLRTLSVRGLVEKVSSSDDSRTYLYQPTADLLAHLGVSKKEELPNYDSVQSDIDTFMQSASAEGEEQPSE